MPELREKIQKIFKKKYNVRTALSSTGNISFSYALLFNNKDDIAPHEQQNEY